MAMAGGGVAFSYVVVATVVAGNTVVTGVTDDVLAGAEVPATVVALATAVASVTVVVVTVVLVDVGGANVVTVVDVVVSAQVTCAFNSPQDLLFSNLVSE